MSKGRLRATADRILHRNNAQEILQALANLEEHRAEFTTRWMWELIQNARDFPDKSHLMTIRIGVADEQITFAHNGRDFTDEEILSLIYHGSTKQSNPEQLGQFGTGFLSTHLLSRRVRVRGTLRDKQGARTGFEFNLDRSGDDADEVGAAMQRSLDELEDSLETGDRRPSDWTEYTYDIDGALNKAELIKDFPFEAIPYILVFDRNIDKIELRLPDRQATYERAENEDLDTGTRLTVIEGMDSILHFVTYEESGIHAAIPAAERDDGNFELLLPDEVPRFFKFLPLVNTKDVGLPLVFHNPLFATTDSRDGLHFGASGPQSLINKGLLTKASRCFLQLARNCAAEGFGNLHFLLDVTLVTEPPAWLADRSWYLELQRTIVRELSQMALVLVEEDEARPALEVDLPLGDTRMGWDDVHRFGAALNPDRSPLKSIAEDCSVIAEEWMSLLGEDDELIQDCILTPSRLIDTVKETGSLQALGEALAFDREETVGWLNALIAAVPEKQRSTTLEGIIPDQTEDGTFRSNAALRDGSEIDDALKDILEVLGDPIRKRLMHAGVAGAELMVSVAQQLEPVVANTKDLIKKRAAASPRPPEFRTACLKMFRWLAAERRWDDLADALPVFTLDGDDSERVSKTSASAASILAPRELWPEGAQPYWDAFPNGSVLVADYAPLLDAELWDEAAANEVVIKDLLWTEEAELTDLEKYTRNLELEGDEHSAVAPIRVGQLALVGTEGFYNAVRGSRERAARFLQLILNYVVDSDPSWRERVEVACECGQSHEIIPCEWLAWMRDREWVPRRRGGHEQLNDASLALLTRHDERLADVVTREEHSEFLNLVGINVLEQALLATDQSQRSELRRRFAQLAKLAVQHPGAVAQVIEKIEAHHEAGKRWRENQTLGKLIENLLETRLKLHLRPLRIRVKTQFKGYDLGAYVEDDSFADVGSIDVETGTLLAKIEIKATRGETVSMSNRQGEEASNDQAPFWLCVIPLDRNDSIDNLTAERIGDLACFVAEIGRRLAPARDDIEDAVQSADESGFDLEHVDGIRYGIRTEIWDDDAISLEGFVEVVGKQASATRG